MSKCRNSLLFNENFVTYGAMLTFSKSGCGTSRSNCFVGYFGMSGSSNSNGFAADLYTAYGTVNNLIVRTVSSTGGCSCIFNNGGTCSVLDCSYLSAYVTSCITSVIIYVLVFLNRNVNNRRSTVEIVGNNDLNCTDIIFTKGDGALSPIGHIYRVARVHCGIIIGDCGRNGCIKSCLSNLCFVNDSFYKVAKLNSLTGLVRRKIRNCFKLCFRLNGTVLYVCEFQISNTIFFEIRRIIKCSDAHIKTGHKLVEGNEVALTVFLKVIEFTVAIKVKGLVYVGVRLVGFVVEVLIKLAFRIFEDVVAGCAGVISCGDYKVTFLVPIAVFILNFGKILDLIKTAELVVMGIRCERVCNDLAIPILVPITHGVGTAFCENTGGISNGISVVCDPVRSDSTDKHTGIAIPIVLIVRTNVVINVDDCRNVAVFHLNTTVTVGIILTKDTSAGNSPGAPKCRDLIALVYGYGVKSNSVSIFFIAKAIISGIPACTTDDTAVADVINTGITVGYSDVLEYCGLAVL